MNWFNESGFLAESLINYMVFLGWSPGDEKEIYSLDELINDFTLGDVPNGFGLTTYFAFGLSEALVGCKLS